MESIDTGDPSEERVKLFVGQIHRDIDEEFLKSFFGAFGPIADLTIIRDVATSISKGCAFVTFFHAQSARNAVEKLHDKVKLPNSLNMLQVRIAETQVERENKLFIGMLPKTVNEENLEQMFGPFGELREVHVIRGPDGSPKGCAFVKFVDKDAAMLAIQSLNNIIPQGSSRPLVVKFADSKKTGSRPQGLDTQFVSMTAYPPVAPSGSPDWSQGIPVSTANLQYYGKTQTQMPLQQYQQHQQLLLHSPHPHSHTMPQPMHVMNQPFQQYMPMQPFVPYTTGMGGQHQQALRPDKINISPMADGSMPHYTQPRLPNEKPPGSHIDYRIYSSMSNTPVSGSYGVGTSPVAGTGPKASSPTALTTDTSNQRPTEGPNGANLFIYHLPRDLTDADLATLFSPFGNVISAKVYVDKRTADSKGFGFVSFDDSASASGAIAGMNGFQIGSKRLKVQHKRTYPSDNLVSVAGMQGGAADMPSFHNHAYQQHQHQHFRQPHSGTVHDSRMQYHRQQQVDQQVEFDIEHRQHYGMPVEEMYQSERGGAERFLTTNGTSDMEMPKEPSYGPVSSVSQPSRSFYTQNHNQDSVADVNAKDGDRGSDSILDGMGNLMFENQIPSVAETADAIVTHEVNPSL